MRPWLIIVILSLIWSSTWLAIKLGLETMPPFLSAGWRFLIAFVTLLIYALKNKLPFPKDWKTHRFFLLFSLINFTAGYALVYWGEQYINSGLTSVLFTVMPFYVVLFSIKMLPHEKISWKKFAGIIVGFSGVIVIFHDQLYLGQPMAFWGMMAVLLSPGFSALGTIMGKIARAKFHPVTLNTYPLLYTALTLFGMHFLFEYNLPVHYSLTALLSLFYLGVFGTAIAFVGYFYLLKTTSAVLMSLITYVTPPIALIWGWLVLNETISWQLLLGMIIIFGGIAMVRYSD